MFSERVHSRVAQRANTRARVLAAAEELFRTSGYDATTIRRIASAAQVSAGTVIAVGDKDTLLVTVYDEWISAIHSNRESDVISNATPLTAEAVPSAILELFTPFVEHFARDPELSRSYAAIIVSGKVESEIFTQLRRALIAEIQATLARAGHGRERAERGAHVIYFGYLGMLMAAGTRAATDRTDLAHFLDIIRFVTNSSIGKETS